MLARYGEFCSNIVDDFELLVPVNTETVGQCTGLKDKNGRLIFEGDVLFYAEKGGVVKYDNGCYVFLWKTFDKYRPDFFKKCVLTNYANFNNLEIIGNIHNNPELLEVEK